MGHMESDPGLRGTTVQACTSRHRHSNYDVIMSPTVGGGRHCSSASSLISLRYLSFVFVGIDENMQRVSL